MAILDNDPDPSKLANWFKSDQAFEEALSNIRGKEEEIGSQLLEVNSFEETEIDESEIEEVLEDEIPAAGFAPIIPANLALFIRGFLLVHTDTNDHFPRKPDRVRVSCDSTRQERRDRFKLVFQEVARVHPVVGHQYVNLTKDQFHDISQPPTGRKMLKDPVNYKLLLAGVIANQRAIPGEKEFHRLTLPPPLQPLVEDFANLSQTHFSFRIGRLEPHHGNTALVYKYPPVREALLKEPAVAELPFITKILPPYP